LAAAPIEDAAPTERTPEREGVPPTERNVEPTAKPARERQPAAKERASASPWLRMLMPIALGAAVAVAAVTQLEPSKQAPKASYDIEGPAALTANETEASDCASCHARQVSEWRRSVMGHAVKSPLFNGLESVIQEQVGRDFDCPNGAGILRKTNNQVACRDPQSGLAVSGSGGEHWCVNCHSPAENLEGKMPVWEGRANGNPQSRLPVRDILSARGMEGISCGFCHQVHGPVNPRGRGYQGNPSWTSFVTGQVFQSRPEDRASLFGIANSGYLLDSTSFLSSGRGGGLVPHKLHDEAQSKYLRSSEFCGSCHDVRLFGTDVLGARKGEQFKRLRNGYTEWAEWAAIEKRKGKTPATCQDCHMSTFPGVCEPAPGATGDNLCPDDTKFAKRAPGIYAQGHAARGSKDATSLSSHYLSGVDLPLAREYPEVLLDEAALDIDGVPISAKARRDALLQATFDFQVEAPTLRGSRLSVPLVIENVGAGHRVPAGFSQEREIWVHLTVKDKAGRVLYEVGRVDRDDEDLRDKVFVRVNTNPNQLDGNGRPIGMFGADIRDGVDHPQWSPPPDLGGTRFTGKGLINFQNGFLRCVTCIGIVAADGRCQPGPGQGQLRADRFADGQYDIDTGECRSNLSGQNALFETYFPIGALDSFRGLPKAPDAIVDTRSVPPGVPITYTYDLDLNGARGPFTIEARLLFRAFPPYLIRAFADYERQMAALGKRPSGPSVDEGMLKRIEVVELAKVKRTVNP
jgi:eukaryotic-like serine/threonine-protein kinase